MIRVDKFFVVAKVESALPEAVYKADNLPCIRSLVRQLIMDEDVPSERIKVFAAYEMDFRIEQTIDVHLDFKEGEG